MKEPIRVLQVFHGMDCGGAENMIMNLYRRIDRSKVQFDFLVHTDKKCFFDDEIREFGGNIYFVPYFNGINVNQYKKALNDFFKIHKEIKVVHGHLGSCAHIYLTIAKDNGCFTIAHSHNTKPNDFSLKNVMYRLFTFKTRRVADYFMGCGKEAGEYRFGQKIVTNSKKYCTLVNAIDTDRFVYDQNVRSVVRSEFGISDDTTLIGHVGRFNYQKNHDYLLDVIKEVTDKNVNVKAMLVGEGNLKEQIETKAADLGILDKVIFTGVRNDVNRLLQAFDCFVFPSHFEGLPVTVIEAQASGLPCIISDKITSEVKITNLVTFCSIDGSPSEWAKKIIESKQKIRKNMKSVIVSAGYDISSTVKFIKDLYINGVDRVR